MIGLAEPLAASNRPRAIKLYDQMQRNLYANAPAVPLYVQRYQRVMLKSVGGFVDNPAYPNVTFVYELRPGA
jgi:peptide/nickel transport system substrate-binding protein